MGLVNQIIGEDYAIQKEQIFIDDNKADAMIKLIRHEYGHLGQRIL